MEYQALNLAPWQTGTFWVFVAVLIFVVLAGRKILAAIFAILDARTQAVRDALEQAEQLKAEAQAMLESAKSAQAQAAIDAQTILQSAHTSAERLTAELTASAKAAAHWRERMALERIAAAQAAAVKDVRAAAIDIATATSAQILREGFAADVLAAQLDETITQLPTALRKVS